MYLLTTSYRQKNTLTKTLSSLMSARPPWNRVCLIWNVDYRLKTPSPLNTNATYHNRQNVQAYREAVVQRELYETPEFKGKCLAKLRALIRGKRSGNRRYGERLRYLSLQNSSGSLVSLFRTSQMFVWCPKCPTPDIMFSSKICFNELRWLFFSSEENKFLRSNLNVRSKFQITYWLTKANSIFFHASGTGSYYPFLCQACFGNAIGKRNRLLCEDANFICWSDGVRFKYTLWRENFAPWHESMSITSRTSESVGWRIATRAVCILVFIQSNRGL